MTIYVRRKAKSPYELYALCVGGDQATLGVWEGLSAKNMHDWFHAFNVNPKVTFALEKCDKGYYLIEAGDEIKGTHDNAPAVYKVAPDVFGEGYLLYQPPPPVAGAAYWKNPVKVKDSIDHNKYRCINSPKDSRV